MEAKRITLWGWVALLGLIVALVVAYLDFRRRDAPIASGLALLSISAAAGWLTVSAVFRWRSRPLVAWPIAGAVSLLSVLAVWTVSLLIGDGFVIGACRVVSALLVGHRSDSASRTVTGKVFDLERTFE